MVTASLDGFIAGPNGEVDWIVPDPDRDLRALFNQFDTALLGRRTYELTQRPDAPPWPPGMSVYVFSRTLRQRDHPERHPLRAKDDAVAEFAENLPPPCRLGFHLSLQDPMMRLTATPGLRLRCPFCHNPLHLACGGSFRIQDTTRTTTTGEMRQLGKFGYRWRAWRWPDPRPAARPRPAGRRRLPQNFRRSLSDPRKQRNFRGSTQADNRVRTRLQTPIGLCKVLS
jgi:hypothetical protein